MFLDIIKKMSKLKAFVIKIKNILVLSIRFVIRTDLCQLPRRLQFPIGLKALKLMWYRETTD